MKCPVCKIELNFAVQNLDDTYYDCSNCDSSLLFKNGECEVLNKGTSKESHSQKGLSEDISKQNEPLQEGHSVKEEVESIKTPKEDISKQNEPLQEGHSVKEEVESTKTPREDTPSQNFSEKENADQVLLEEAKLEGGEEFVPNETTQVPENPFIEKNSENFSEQEEDKQKNQDYLGDPEEKQDSKLQKGEKTSDHSTTSEKDFPFEKEQEEVPSELPDSEIQKEDFSEVAEFGNTQDQDKQGPFLYDLILNEINSKNVREKVLSTLEDTSLNLPLNKEVKSIEDSIKDGKLVIKKISPVQAYVIVTSLMGLPLSISWTQHHIAES